MSEKNKNLSLADLEEKFFARQDIIGGDYDLNYCIPINIGIISQEFEPDLHSRSDIVKAVEKFGNQLQKNFGKFTARDRLKKDRNDSRIQLTVYVRRDDTSEITSIAAEMLKSNFNATVKPVDAIDEMKQKCWLVLALWDGVANGEAFEAVRSILCYQPEKSTGEYEMKFPENRPVFQIVLPAARDNISDIKAEGSVKNYSVRDIYPRVLEKPDDANVWYDRYNYPRAKSNHSRRRNFNKSVRKIRQFNKTIIKYASKRTNQTENVYDLLPDYREKIIPSLASDAAVLRQVCYDVISMKAQLDHRFETTAVLGFASLGLFFYSLYSDFFTFKPAVYIFIVMFILSYIFYLFGAKLGGNQNYFLEFRALAESMRVQCYWYTAGINESVGDHYKVKFNKDMSWAKYAINRWYESDTLYQRFDFEEKNDALICKEWLVDQYGFFKARIKRYGQYASYLKTGDFISKLIWLAAAIILAIVLWNSQPGENVFIFAIGIINVITLIMSYLSEKLLFKELTARYAYCSILAEKAVDDFNHQVARPADIFKKYGIEALAENAEWLMIENDREPDVPNG